MEKNKEELNNLLMKVKEESEIISLSEVWALEWGRAEFESGFFTYQLFDFGLILLSEPQFPSQQ